MAEYAVGCNGVDQYLQINDSRINLDQGETLIWIGTLEPKDGETFHYILSTGAFNSSNFNCYYNQVDKYFGANKFSNPTSQNAYPNILTGTPHLVAAQRDSGNETYAIVCEAGGTAEYLEIATNSSQTVPVPWYIMRRGDASVERYAKGTTHKMAFFSSGTDLTKAEIEAIAAGADPRDYGGILLNWPMNEGAGNKAFDTQEDPAVEINMYNMPVDDSHWVLLSGEPIDERFGSWAVSAISSVQWTGYRQAFGSALTEQIASVQFDGTKLAIGTAATTANAASEFTGYKTALGTFPVLSQVNSSLNGFKTALGDLSFSTLPNINFTATKTAFADFSVNAIAEVNWAGSSIDIRFGNFSVQANANAEWTGTKATSVSWAVRAVGHVPVTGQKSASGSMPAAVQSQLSWAGFRTAYAKFDVVAVTTFSWAGYSDTAAYHPHIITIQGVDAPLIVRGVDAGPITLQGRI